jgi:pyrimidine operon attenuation protein/uracil phosphoribosyltransferase
MPRKQRKDSSENRRAPQATSLVREDPTPELDSFAQEQRLLKPTTCRCFVIMPSGNHGEYEKGPRESDFIYNDIIRPAAMQALGDEIVIHREADKRIPGAITREIVKNAALADVVIVDLTGQNPNVFFELGIRYALRSSTTVLIKQKSAEVPFDIRVYRCVEYDPLFEGVKRSRDDIARAISEAVNEASGRSDSLVFDIFPHLSVEIPGLLTQAKANLPQSSMTWPEYLETFNQIIERVEPKVRSGEYSPDLLMGISNGGMMFADLLGMKSFLFQIPKVALWAHRGSPDVNYFQNDINDALMLGINGMFKQRKTFNVILADDFIASGHTIRQAVKYVTDKLPKAHVALLPLVCRSHRYIDMFNDLLIWFQPPFSYPEADIKQLHATERIAFPYDKEIRAS